MSPTRKPSTVAGLRRGVGAAAPAELPERTATAAELADESARFAQARTASERPSRPRPEKPVRFTLDLDRDLHQFLKGYAADIEADASQVLRALIGQLRESPNLSARVQADVWGSRR